MKVVATRTTAALTGVWTALGMGSLVVWEKHNPLDVTTQNIVFLSMAIVFFFIPVFLFVIGPQKYYGIRDMASRDYWENFIQVGIRGLEGAEGDVVHFVHITDEMIFYNFGQRPYSRLFFTLNTEGDEKW